MDNKGFATTGIIFAVLLVTMIIMTVFFNPILNTSVNIKNSKELMPEYINDVNGLERVYSVFKENISHDGNIKFEDIGKEYKVNSVKEEYSEIVLDNNNSFNVNNKTDIDIYFEVYPIDDRLPASYSVNVMLGNKNVVNKNELTNNSTINIDNNYLYNKEDGTNYGKYTIDVDTINCDVKTKVKFKKLDYREVEITNDNMKQTIGIKNNVDNVDVYFIRG